LAVLDVLLAHNALLVTSALAAGAFLSPTLAARAAQAVALVAAATVVAETAMADLTGLAVAALVVLAADARPQPRLGLFPMADVPRQLAEMAAALAAATAQTATAAENAVVATLPLACLAMLESMLTATAVLAQVGRVLLVVKDTRRATLATPA